MGAVEHLKTLCCLGLKPESAMIAVTPLLHEIIPHGSTRIWRMAPIAHAARVLRESGATPAQTKVGIQLALGKPKSVIADALGLQLSSVAELTKGSIRTSMSTLPPS